MHKPLETLVNMVYNFIDALFVLCFNSAIGTYVQGVITMMELPIENYLKNNYDVLKRDELGIPVYDKQLQQVSDKLLEHFEGDLHRFQSYYEFSYALLSKILPANLEVRLLPAGTDCKKPYVSSVVTGDIWKEWRPGNSVFIAAGTGKGKNTFIKKELLNRIGAGKVIVFENRQSLLQQQALDLVAEIDPDVAKYSDFFNDGMVIFGRGQFMLISYQKAALKCALQDQKFMDFCGEESYLVFDEAHFILDDAYFNKGIAFFTNHFFPDTYYLKQHQDRSLLSLASFGDPQRGFQNYRNEVVQVGSNNVENEFSQIQRILNKYSKATRIYMSASMEEFYAFFQTLLPFETPPKDILKEKRELENGDSSMRFVAWQLHEADSTYEPFHVLSMPTDYSYLIPYEYTTLEDVCLKIAETPTDEKWLIFVTSIKKGMELHIELGSICGSSVCFLDAENRNSKENREIYQQLIHKSSYNCRVLIATTVIYNGINIKDDEVKHIVLPFTTPPMVKQLIGRKRLAENEKVNVYFPIVAYQEIQRRFRGLIGEHIGVKELRKSLVYEAMIQSNNLAKSEDSKYYHLSVKSVWNAQNRKYDNFLIPEMNQPAIYKLYFDSCFYMFALHRMDPALGEHAASFVEIMMQHLNNADKCPEVIDITVQTSEDQKEQVRSELNDFLENLIGTPIISPDENGSYDLLLNLKGMINASYKRLHGDNIDQQWNNSGRFISKEKTKTFFKELSLPFDIESKKKNDIRITEVKKLM